MLQTLNTDLIECCIYIKKSDISVRERSKTDNINIPGTFLKLAINSKNSTILKTSIILHG